MMFNVIANRKMNKWSYRQRAMKLVDDGIIDCRMLMLSCLRHMSQDDIKDMLIGHKFIDNENLESITIERA